MNSSIDDLVLPVPLSPQVTEALQKYFKYQLSADPMATPVFPLNVTTFCPEVLSISKTSFPFGLQFSTKRIAINYPAFITSSLNLER